MLCQSPPRFFYQPQCKFLALTLRPYTKTRFPSRRLCIKIDGGCRLCMFTTNKVCSFLYLLRTVDYFGGHFVLGDNDVLRNGGNLLFLFGHGAEKCWRNNFTVKVTLEKRCVFSLQSTREYSWRWCFESKSIQCTDYKKGRFSQRTVSMNKRFEIF